MEEWFCVFDFICSDFIILARLHCFWWIGVADQPVTTALTTHYLCWTSLTSPDSRSFRPSGGSRGIHFLNWWIVLGKAPNPRGHSQNYWLKKILVLRSILPRYGFSMMVSCGYTMPSKYGMKFLGVHLGTYCIGRVGWQGVVVSIQPHKPTCFLWFFSKHIPKICTRTHSKKIPLENVQKTR